MCRHVAYLGPPRSLAALLVDPPFSLHRQSWAPRRQRHGTVNADGYGVGWYALGLTVPAVLRRAQPIWTDASFASLAPAVRSGAVLAAVRSATPPSPVEESATAPFSGGGMLFSHNGAVDPAVVRRHLPVGAVPESRCDSALLWELVRARRVAGADLVAALTGTVRTVAAGRLNLLATDGETIVATAWGDTLCWRERDDAVLVASEPDDDEPGWVEVPDRTVLVARPGRVTTFPLTDATPPPAA